MKLSAQLRKGFTHAQKLGDGFTLIELLVVIAVIGVLAAIVLIGINPAEQLARGRDTSRLSSVTQMGRALQGYYTSQNPAVYPAVATWSTDLTASGDLKAIPGAVAGGTACVNNIVNSTWCYKLSLGEAIIYARLEATLYRNKCTTAADEPFWVFSTTAGRSGGQCADLGAAAEPLVNDITFEF